MCPFLTAQSPDGEVFLFLYIKGAVCRFTGISAQHTQQTGFIHVQSQAPPLSVTSPVFWVTWPCFIDCGHFGLGLHIQRVHYRRSTLSKAFHTTLQSDRLGLFKGGATQVVVICPHPPAFTEDLLLLQLPVIWNKSLHYSETWRLFIMWLEGENCIMLFPSISLCMPPPLAEGMQCTFLAWWTSPITG